MSLEEEIGKFNVEVKKLNEEITEKKVETYRWVKLWTDLAEDLFSIKISRAEKKVRLLKEEYDSHIESLTNNIENVKVRSG